MLAIAGLLTAIGSVMTWAKLVVDGTTVDSVAGTDGQRDGKITVVLGVMLVALAIVVLARQGRLWVGIVGIVLSAVSVLVALADIGDVSDHSDDLGSFGQVDVGGGLILVLIASLVGLGASITAVCIRRPRS